MTGNSSGNSSASKRNPIAKEVRQAKFRMRVVRSRKLYKRKGRVAQQDRATAF